MLTAFSVPGISTVSFASDGAVSVESEEVVPAKWTIALYVDADNNLEYCYDMYTYPFLLNLPDSSEVNVVAWVDRLSTTGYEIVEFSGDQTEITYCGTELGFGLSATFRDFLLWADSTYPSENLLVTIWDHGSPWKSFCSDDTDGSRMYGPDFDLALREAAVWIDLLGIDACSMSSMERFYEICRSDMIGITVASEELVPGNGFAYDLMFAPVIEDPSRTPVQVAGDMILGWEAYYGHSQRVNLVAIDVPAFKASIPAFIDWTADMAAGVEKFDVAYNCALKHAYTVSGSVSQVDIVHLAQLLYEELAHTHSGSDGRALADSTRELIDALKGTVLAISRASVTVDTEGLTIWWGYAGCWLATQEFYLGKVWLAQETGWGDFLELYNAA